jgi:hypothetical protein
MHLSSTPCPVEPEKRKAIGHMQGVTQAVQGNFARSIPMRNQGRFWIFKGKRGKGHAGMGLKGNIDVDNDKALSL